MTTPRRAALWIAAAVLARGACAQTATDASQAVGFRAGPWIIAPSLIAGCSYDSNVLFQPDELHPTPDRVISVQPALQLTLPFSHSRFRFGDTLRWLDYGTTPQTAGKTANDANAELALGFGTGDELGLAARSVAGIAETVVFDPSGEAQGLQGNAYDFHTETLSLQRQIPDARGYRFAVTRNVLSFERPVPFDFVEYRGFDGEGAYTQPLSPNTRLSFGYLGSRYDLYLLSPVTDPTQVFRTENGNALYVQAEGRLGPRQPYSVRVGWERLTFGLDAGLADYSGPIWNASMGAILGGGTTVAVTIQRQPYRSTSADQSFYLTDQLGGSVARSFRGGSTVGGRVMLSRYTFGQPIAGTYRTDRAYLLELYGSLAVQDRVNFRISILSNRRWSNYVGGAYDSIAVFGGFVLGWI